MLTFFDAVEALIISSYGGPQDAEQRDIRTAIHRAYSELTTIRDWSYYSVFGRIVLQGAYSTGTVALSGGNATHSGTGWSSVSGLSTYPKHFTLRTGARNYQIDGYTSSSVLTLTDPDDTWSVPAAGFSLFRSIYPLPADFRNLDEPTSEYRWWSGVYITPDEAMKLERINYPAGVPLNWTVIKDPHGTGWAIKLVGYPTQKESLDFTYRRSPRALRWSGHETGARFASLTSAGDDLWLQAAAGTFDATMVGSVVRLSSTSTYPGPIESLTPYTSQHTILGREFANVANDSAVIGAHTPVSGVAGLVTDPIDVAQHMQQAMYSACNYFLARIRGDKEDKASQLYQRDLRLAMEQDQLAPLSGRSKNVYHDGGWRSPLKPDRGA